MSIVPIGWFVKAAVCALVWLYCILFAIVLSMGVIGIAVAMCLDWSMRGIIFWLRFRQGRWKSLQVIGAYF